MGWKGWRRRRAAEHDLDKFWRQGVPFDTRRESRLGFGFFNALSQSGKAAGVLFVTDRRVVFRFVASEPGMSVALGMGGFASGGFFMKTYEQITKVAKGDPPRPGYFGILYTDNGQGTGLILEPADDEPGVQAVCEEMYKTTRAAHEAALTQ